MSVLKWTQQRPWIWLVVLVVVFVLLDVIFMMIAVRNRPITVGGQQQRLPNNELLVAQVLHPTDRCHAAEQQLHADQDNESGANAMEQ